MFFLDQANFSSNSFQIWQLQYPIPRASLPPLPFLSNFTLANWNPSTTQSSSCSSSVSLFCSSPFNHMSSYWMYQTIYQAKPETEIVEVYRPFFYTKNDLCFNIKNISSNSFEHVFSKLSYQKLNLLPSEYFTDLQIIFKIYFYTISSKLNAKPMKFIFSETLIPTYFKI